MKKIGECEAEIAKCEEKINDVDTELMKEGIRADNLAFWREEKKQLRKEKEQLRDKEMQYLKERELLLTKSLANGARVRTLKNFPSPSRQDRLVLP